MSAKHYIPWVGRLYKERDSARAERDAAADNYRKGFLYKSELVDILANSIPPNVPFPDWGRERFLRSLPGIPRILDVGCGNNSPYYTKRLLPNCYYIGIDIQDYNLTDPNLADEYILTSPKEFCSKIVELKGIFDAVISSHNLEHCDDRSETLIAMAQALKSGGRLYLSFPCSESVSFPNRRGCLNYFDDQTHKYNPPDFTEVVAVLHKEDLRVLYADTRYQPPIGWIVGLRNEAASATDGEVKEGTWSLWGFETVVWAEKR